MCQNKGDKMDINQHKLYTVDLVDQYLEITTEALPSIQRAVNRNLVRNLFRKKKKSVAQDALELWKKGKLTQGQIKRAKIAKKAKQEATKKKIKDKIKHIRGKFAKISKFTKKGR